MLDLEARDTIAAIASPPGPAVRGIVRVSGPEAVAIALEGFEPAGSELQAPLGSGPSLRDGAYRLPGIAAVLPAKVLVWTGERTYTGRPQVEAHTLGSPPLLDALLARFLEKGARLARPGEFTLRAFLAGRLDLTRAEAVLGVIDARTEQQLARALEQLAGGLFEPLQRLRDQLLETVSHLEAGLDFVDEADVDPLAREALAAELAAGASTVEALTHQLDARDRRSTLPRVVLTGAPNAGKSTLFNLLAGEDRAIVSEVPGTTRDYLTAAINPGAAGASFELIDTAGADPAHQGAIDAEAQRRREDQARAADLLIVCHPADLPSAWTADEPREPGDDVPRLLVATRCDRARPPVEGWLATSARTGEGLEALRDAIQTSLAAIERDRSCLGHSGARCRQCLVRASQSLAAAAEAIRRGDGDELVAIDLHAAIASLGEVVGATFTDDVLDRIFRRFCIGK